MLLRASDSGHDWSYSESQGLVSIQVNELEKEYIASLGCCVLLLVAYLT